ncbi:MAG TPA: AMP-binding protein [Candidatus Paceibacterota bacterium]
MHKIFRNDAIDLSRGLSDIWDSTFSDFYRATYEKAGFTKEQVTDPEFFTKLPFLTRADLEQTSPLDRLYTEEGDIDFIAYTSGTTSGKPVITFHTLLPHYKYDPTLGVDVHRILVTYPPFNKNFGPMFIRMCKEASRPVFPISADYQNLANSAIIARDTKADALYATPTLAALLAPHLREHYSAEAIKLIVLCSETLTDARRNELERAYPNAVIANTYGSSEIGRHIFYPCPDMLAAGRPHFHPIFEDIAVIELIDHELVITYLADKAFPLIRYRTGDYFEEAPACTCGRPGPTLAWRGRDNVDRVRANGVEIFLDDVEKVFVPLVPLIGDAYQLHFYSSDDAKVRVVVEIENAKASEDPTLMQYAYAQVLGGLLGLRLGASATLATAIEKGLFTEPEIVFVESLSVKTTKAKRLVSHL